LVSTNLKELIPLRENIKEGAIGVMSHGGIKLIGKDINKEGT
jgi:hypothetical protein